MIRSMPNASAAIRENTSSSETLWQGIHTPSTLSPATRLHRAAVVAESTPPLKPITKPCAPAAFRVLPIHAAISPASLL